MKCYKCNGTGEYDIEHECPYCGGTGEINDIITPPFTDGQKEVIEATEKLANGKLICDVDGIDDDVRDVKKLLEETITMIEKSNICESCVSKNICGNPNITGCISYTKQDEKFLPVNCSGRIAGNSYRHPSKCTRCNGTGEINYYTLTNEDFLRMATTEQLAEFLCNVAVTDVLWDKIRQPYYTDGKQAVVEWLKQPHRGEP